MLQNQCSFRHSSLNLPLKLSMYALSFGLPGRMTFGEVCDSYLAAKVNIRGSTMRSG